MIKFTLNRIWVACGDDQIRIIHVFEHQITLMQRPQIRRCNIVGAGSNARALDKTCIYLRYFGEYTIKTSLVGPSRKKIYEPFMSAWSAGGCLCWEAAIQTVLTCHMDFKSTMMNVVCRICWLDPRWYCLHNVFTGSGIGDLVEPMVWYYQATINLSPGSCWILNYLL